MKKIVSALLLIVIAASLFACNINNNGNNVDPSKKSEGVMTHAEYMAAEIGADVVIEAYVQATQSWFENKITVYAADPDGAYFIYEMACSEDDAKKLTPGTKIKVTGVKGEWAGEIEVMDPAFEFGNDVTYISEVQDLTAHLGNDTLAGYQNAKAVFKGLTVVSTELKSTTNRDDIYVNVSKDGNEYTFCLEYYLNGSDDALYEAVSNLAAGEVIDIECFLYWYNGPNPHITKLTKVN